MVWWPPKLSALIQRSCENAKETHDLGLVARVMVVHARDRDGVPRIDRCLLR